MADYDDVAYIRGQMIDELNCAVTFLHPTFYATSDGTEYRKDFSAPITEKMKIQTLDIFHEKVAEGWMEVGDIKFTAKANSQIEDEDWLTFQGDTYQVSGVSTRDLLGQVVEITGYGKKLVNR